MIHKMEITFTETANGELDVKVLVDKTAPINCIEVLENVAAVTKQNMVDKIEAHLKSLGGVPDDKLDAVITEFTNKLTFADLV